MMKKAQEPNPEREAAQKAAEAAQLAIQEAQAEALRAQARSEDAKAAKLKEETRFIPEEIKTKRISALSINLDDGEQDEKNFARRLQAAEFDLKVEQADNTTPEERGVQNTLGAAIQSRLDNSPQPIG